MTKSSGTRSPRDIPCRTRRSSSSTEDEQVPKVKLEMDQSLTARKHQEARDKLEMDGKHDTSDIYRMCQRQLMGAVVEVTEVWLDI
jgi:hypothetical protein